MSGHLIDALDLDFRFDDEALAFDLQSRLVDCARRGMAELIADRFDRASPPDEVLRIDTLELDLGVLPADDFEAVFLRRLGEALDDWLAGLRARGATPSRLARGEADIEALRHFLLHGRLPWHVGGTDAATLDRLARSAMVAAPDALARSLGPLLDRPGVARRLDAQFAPAWVARLRESAHRMTAPAAGSETTAAHSDESPAASAMTTAGADPGENSAAGSPGSPLGTPLTPEAASALNASARTPGRVATATPFRTPPAPIAAPASSHAHAHAVATVAVADGAPGPSTPDGVTDVRRLRLLDRLAGREPFADASIWLDALADDRAWTVGRLTEALRIRRLRRALAAAGDDRLFEAVLTLWLAPAEARRSARALARSTRPGASGVGTTAEPPGVRPSAGVAPASAASTAPVAQAASIAPAAPSAPITAPQPIRELALATLVFSLDTADAGMPAALDVASITPRRLRLLVALHADDGATLAAELPGLLAEDTGWLASALAVLGRERRWRRRLASVPLTPEHFARLIALWLAPEPRRALLAHVGLTDERDADAGAEPSSLAAGTPEAREAALAHVLLDLDAGRSPFDAAFFGAAGAGAAEASSPPGMPLANVPLPLGRLLLSLLPELSRRSVPPLQPVEAPPPGAPGVDLTLRAALDIALGDAPRRRRLAGAARAERLLPELLALWLAPAEVASALAMLRAFENIARTAVGEGGVPASPSPGAQAEAGRPGDGADHDHAAVVALDRLLAALAAGTGLQGWLRPDHVAPAPRSAAGAGTARTDADGMAVGSGGALGRTTSDDRADTDTDTDTGIGIGIGIGIGVDADVDGNATDDASADDLPDRLSRAFDHADADTLVRLLPAALSTHGERIARRLADLTRSASYRRQLSAALPPVLLRQLPLTGLTDLNDPTDLARLPYRTESGATVPAAGPNPPPVSDARAGSLPYGAPDASLPAGGQPLRSTPADRPTADSARTASIGAAQAHDDGPAPDTPGAVGMGDRAQQDSVEAPAPAPARRAARVDLDAAFHAGRTADFHARLRDLLATDRDWLAGWLRDIGRARRLRKRLAAQLDDARADAIARLLLPAVIADGMTLAADAIAPERRSGWLLDLLLTPDTHALARPAAALFAALRDAPADARLRRLWLAWAAALDTLPAPASALAAAFARPAPNRSHATTASPEGSGASALATRLLAVLPHAELIGLLRRLADGDEQVFDALLTLVDATAAGTPRTDIADPAPDAAPATEAAEAAEVAKATEAAEATQGADATEGGKRADTESPSAALLARRQRVEALLLLPLPGADAADLWRDDRTSAATLMSFIDDRVTDPDPDHDDLRLSLATDADWLRALLRDLARSPRQRARLAQRLAIAPGVGVLARLLIDDPQAPASTPARPPLPVNVTAPGQPEAAGAASRSKDAASSGPAAVVTSAVSAGPVAALRSNGRQAETRRPGKADPLVDSFEHGWLGGDADLLAASLAHPPGEGLTAALRERVLDLGASPRLRARLARLLAPDARARLQAALGFDLGADPPPDALAAQADPPELPPGAFTTTAAPNTATSNAADPSPAVVGTRQPAPPADARADAPDAAAITAARRERVSAHLLRHWQATPAPATDARLHAELRASADWRLTLAEDRAWLDGWLDECSARSESRAGALLLRIVLAARETPPPPTPDDIAAASASGTHPATRVRRKHLAHWMLRYRSRGGLGLPPGLTETPAWRATLAEDCEWLATALRRFSHPNRAAWARARQASPEARALADWLLAAPPATANESVAVAFAALTGARGANSDASLARLAARSSAPRAAADSAAHEAVGAVTVGDGPGAVVGAGKAVTAAGEATAPAPAGSASADDVRRFLRHLAEDAADDRPPAAASLEAVRVAALRALASGGSALRIALDRRLDSPLAARRLIELLGPDHLPRATDLLLPASRVPEAVAAAVAAVAIRPNAPARDQLAETAWRLALRHLFEEGRRADASGLAADLRVALEQTLPPGVASTPAIPRDPGQPAADHRIVRAFAPGTPAAAERQPAATARAPVAARASAPDPWRFEDAPPAATEREPIPVTNAGLVLAGPYLPRLLAMLKLVEQGRFTGPDAAERAVHLMQMVVTGQPDTPEPLLVLNKLMCGLLPETPVRREIGPAPAETAAVDGMLDAMRQHWTALGKTSTAGLREAFLQREGRLLRADDRWELRVAPRSYDMLLDRIPWGFRTVKFAWMKEPIHVDWR
ncbi:contractile injection system tape measure protein [Derxia lacustris]|uniref:contractile injection system tape measure protein n=1 Tax=Derxia lacustris TaxID=764842 RepID=UPI0015946988|nr:contractile injection system tape measure protein [Derxia lacustris]